METSKILQAYPKFYESKAESRKFKHQNLIKILDKHRINQIFEFEEVGQSFEGRKIEMIKIGEGKTKVFLWSQMHGNEAVATLALLDLLNFFSSENYFEDLKNQILQKLSIYILPMLNPDGAERFIRRNAQGIDLNRDAKKLTAPESQILMNLIDKIKPDFGFNLHDQETYYGVENFENNTHIAFLAPAYDFQKSINESRTRSMQVIAKMNETLQTVVPQKVAKYSDAYMPNAFGDQIQTRGVSTILIESGYKHNDKERKYIRKLNFLSFLSAFETIVKQDFTKINIEEYFEIPANIKNKFLDIKIENLTIEKNGKTFTTDIGISYDRSQREKFTDYCEELIIWEIGDLSQYSAFQTFDAKGKVFKDEKNQIKLMEKAGFILKILHT